MSDLVSIVTPSYNTARFIGQTIESVRAQSYARWEMIIVDDCSHDDTDEVVRPFLEDQRIKYLRNDSNRGAAYCRNRALREAKGHWVAFLDSDDIWFPDKLEKQVRFMEEGGHHFTYTDYCEVDEEGKPLGTLCTGPKKIGRVRMALFNYMGCLTVMYDKDYIGVIQVADIEKRNDYAIWVKAVKACPAVLLQECLAAYRVRGAGSITDRGKSALVRMRYNYDLWHVSEGKGLVSSCALTGVNTVFGVLKKVTYRRRLKTGR